ncbi:MAG: keto-deoxy-phosphogluconate aldolase, partial [Burkholderiales bacterium]
SPLSQVKFCPTGGINLANAQQYLALPNVIGVGCSFLVPEQLIAHNDFAQVTSLAKQAVNLLNR